MIVFRVTGTHEMSGRLKRMAATVPDQVERALFQEAQIEMTESKRRCPVATGALKGSGTVFRPERNGRTVSVTLAYGGVAAPYAIYVHEDLSAHHPNGEAKFLESVLLESAPFMASRVANRIGLGR